MDTEKYDDVLKRIPTPDVKRHKLMLKWSDDALEILEKCIEAINEAQDLTLCVRIDLGMPQPAIDQAIRVLRDKGWSAEHSCGNRALDGKNWQWIKISGEKSS